MGEMTDYDRRMLADLIESARRQGKWIYHNSMAAGPLWFTPDELAAENAKGKFVWGVVNWQLRDVKEYLAETERLWELAKAEHTSRIEKYRRWNQRETIGT